MKTRFSISPHWLAAGAVAGLAFTFLGCTSCKPSKGPGPAQAYNLQLWLGDTLLNSSVVVDVIAVNQYDLERLKIYSINKYWKPGDPMRGDLPKISFSFVSGETQVQTLSATNASWAKWLNSGVQYLVLIADLPGVFEDGKIGSQDPRRQLLPICECHWPNGTKALSVEVQAGGVRVATAPRPGWSLPPGW